MPLPEHLDPAELIFTPDVADDPHHVYARLRNECPVATADMGGIGVRLISRYEDVLCGAPSP